MPLGFGIGLRLGQPLARAYPAWVPHGASWGFDAIGRRGWRKPIGEAGQSFNEAALATFLTCTGDGDRMRIGSDGLLKTVATDAIRFDHAQLTGTALGLPVESARTNVVLWNRDLTNVAWTKTNVTAAKEQVGIDGVSNSASSITATAGNGTCLQAITLASSARLQSAYFKRLVGSGAVQMTTDGGSTWTTVSVTAARARFSIPGQTLADPTVGFRLATSGDAIAVDYVQNESGLLASSPILVTSVAVDRDAESITSLLSGALADGQGTLVAEWSAPVLDAGTTRRAIGVDNGTSSQLIFLSAKSTTSIVTGGAVVGGVSQADIDAGASVSEQIERVAIAWSANDYAVSRSGGAVLTDTSGSVPSGLTTVRLGRSVAGSHLNGHLRRIFILPTREPDAALPILSAVA